MYTSISSQGIQKTVRFKMQFQKHLSVVRKQKRKILKMHLNLKDHELKIIISFTYIRIFLPSRVRELYTVTM